MKSVFNKDNVGYLTNEYPIFLGDTLGLFDTINIKYPELEDLYQLQISQIWNEYEVDLTQDKMDMSRLPKDVVDLMVFTISWQYLIDTVAAKSITSLIIQHCTNSEAEGLFTAQAMFEIIHARTYSHIVKQTFLNPNDLIKQTYDNAHVLMRAEGAIKVFDALANLPLDADDETKRRALIKAIAALMCLEAISFMASFAVTFGIAETNVFQGISKLVGLICRDEILHARMDHAVFSILMKDPVWKASYNAIKHEIVDVVNLAVEQEDAFSDYLFSDGRQLVGLNAVLIKEYVRYLAHPIYSILEVEAPFAKVVDNPLPYMNKYVDSSEIQSAAQEIQLTAYRVGAIVDDTDELNFDDIGDGNL